MSDEQPISSPTSGPAAPASVPAATVSAGAPQAANPWTAVPLPLPPVGWILQLWLRKMVEDWLRRNPPGQPVPERPPGENPPLAHGELVIWSRRFDLALLEHAHQLNRQQWEQDDCQARVALLELADCCDRVGYGSPFSITSRSNKCEMESVLR